MATLGYLKAVRHGKDKKWDTVRFSVAKLLRGKDVARKAPLVDYESVRFGPANKHCCWDEWNLKNPRN